jgi:hypothetical protein
MNTPAEIKPIPNEPNHVSLNWIYYSTFFKRFFKNNFNSINILILKIKNIYYFNIISIIIHSRSSLLTHLSSSVLHHRTDKLAKAANNC